MAIAFRSLSASAGTSGSPATQNKPTGVVSGDVMLAWLYVDLNATVSTPATGWTQLDLQASATSGQTYNMYVYYKVAGASEPTSYSWTLSAANYNEVLITAFSGVDTTTPIDAHGIRDAGSTASLTTPTITTSTANDCLVAMLVCWNGNAGASAQNSYTLPTNGAFSNNDTWLEYKLNASTGSNGNQAFTCTGPAAGSVVALVALKPASAGGSALSQSLGDTQSALDTRLSQAQKRPSEFLSALDTLTKAYTSSQSEKFSSLDAALKAAQHRLSGDSTSATDSTQRARGAVQSLLDAISSRETATHNAGKGLFEGTAALDTQSNRAGKVQGDTTSSLDSLQRAPTHLVSGDATSATDTMQRARGSVWTIVDALSGRDSITQHAVTKLLGETLSSLDTTRFATTHLLTETFITLDVLSKLPSHLLSEIFSSTDSVSETKNAGAVAWAKTLFDAQSALDVRLAAVQKTLGETQSAQDVRTALIVKTLGEQLVLVDSTSWRTVHRIVDSLSATDKLTAGRALLLALQDWFSSTDVSTEAKQQALAKGQLAVLSLTISALLGVHLAISTSASISAVIQALTLAIRVTRGLTTAIQSQRTLASALQATLTLR